MEKALYSSIRRIYPLTVEAMEAMVAAMEYLELPKGHLLIRDRRVEPYVHFLIHGVARAFGHFGEKELTFWFGTEGSVLLSYNSYIHGKAGYEKIELLEDGVLYRLHNSVLQDLYTQHIEIANWGRKLAEYELIKTEELFIMRQIRSAKERYLHLMKTAPELIQRVRLGQIASYLGVTQVSLSRIRAELKA